MADYTAVTKDQEVADVSEVVVQKSEMQAVTQNHTLKELDRTIQGLTDRKAAYDLEKANLDIEIAKYQAIRDEIERVALTVQLAAVVQPDPGVLGKPV